MSIRKVTSRNSRFFGYWRVRCQPRDPDSGGVISLPVKYVSGTKTDAKHVYDELMAEFHNESTYYKQKKMHFVDAYEAYLRAEHHDGRWEDDTYHDHLYSLKIAKLYFPKVKLFQINESIMRRFARRFVKDHHLRVARGTVLSRRLEHYRSFFNELIGTVYTRNPIPQRAIYKWFSKGEIQVKRPRYVFNQSELDSIRNLIYKKLETAEIQNSVSLIGCLIALETGCRPQEIQVLQWADLVTDDSYNVFKLHDSWNEDLKRPNGHLKSRVSGVYRYTLPISSATFNVLQEFKERQHKFLSRYHVNNEHDYVMLNLRDFRRASEGQVISQKSLNEMIKRLCETLNIGSAKYISMYSLRHSVATRTSSLGMNPAFAASRLGHSVAEYERTYVHEPRDIKDDLMHQWLAQ